MFLLFNIRKYYFEYGKDIKLSEAEFNKLYDKIDVNGDGKLNFEELLVNFFQFS